MNTKVATVDAYIAAFPKPVQQLLLQMRKIIKKCAPEAEESVSYGIPAYKYKGRPLVYFAGYEKHIGFYATPNGHEAFKKELAKYKQGKGSVQFPVSEKLPVALIEKIVRYRVSANEVGTVTKKAAVAVKPKLVTAKATKSKQPDAAQVTDWLNKQEPVTKKMITAIRKIIKAAAPQLNERIKWNAPSYYYTEDVVTFGPPRNGKVLLIFHHPLIVKIKSSLLEGNFKDRRIVSFPDAASIAAAKDELGRIIKEHLKLLGQ